MTVQPFSNPSVRGEERKRGSDDVAQDLLVDFPFHQVTCVGSVGSERGRSLAERPGRFVTDKTLLLPESGNLVLLKELWRDDPGSFGNYFVCPLAVTDTLASVTPQGLRG